MYKYVQGLSDKIYKDQTSYNCWLISKMWRLDAIGYLCIFKQSESLLYQAQFTDQITR